MLVVHTSTLCSVQTDQSLTMGMEWSEICMCMHNPEYGVHRFYHNVQCQHSKSELGHLRQRADAASDVLQYSRCAVPGLPKWAGPFTREVNATGVSREREACPEDPVVGYRISVDFNDQCNWMNYRWLHPLAVSKCLSQSRLNIRWRIFFRSLLLFAAAAEGSPHAESRHGDMLR